MSELRMVQTWRVAVELLEVGLPVTFVAHALGTRSDSKKLLSLRDDVSPRQRGGCCPTSLERQMESHRRRLESSLFLRLYSKCGGSMGQEVDASVFVSALRWYWFLRGKHCLDGVKIIDARAGWLLLQGTRTQEIVEHECAVCGTVYYHLTRSTKPDACPVCAIEQDPRLRRVARAVNFGRKPPTETPPFVLEVTPCVGSARI